MVKRLKGQKDIKIALKRIPKIEKHIFRNELWGIGYNLWSTGKVRRNTIQELKNHSKKISESGKNLKHSEIKDFQS